MKLFRTIFFTFGLSTAAIAATAPPPNHPARPQIRAPFPAIKDWSTLKISLQRSACFGRCPVYDVEIDGDGTVYYDGKNYVAVTGPHEAHISTEAVHALYDAFVMADFFRTFDFYRAPVTDLATYALTIAFDGKQKQVQDYGGRMVNMPPEIAALEDQIDRAAGTAQWVEGPPR